jgi:hypothetical protein
MAWVGLSENGVSPIPLVAPAILAAIVRSTAIKVVAPLLISAAKASASACPAARSAGDQPVCAGAWDSGRAVELCQAAYFRAVGVGLALCSLST